MVQKDHSSGDRQAWVPLCMTLGSTMLLWISGSLPIRCLWLSKIIVGVNKVRCDGTRKQRFLYISPCILTKKFYYAKENIWELKYYVSPMALWATRHGWHLLSNSRDSLLPLGHYKSSPCSCSLNWENKIWTQCLENDFEFQHLY